MEDEASVQFPIPGMELVLATVSGYHGSERFHLIKLIAHSGASYVGSMNGSTTHLVCWKHEGRKYELAKEFGMFIVNHRWVEECVRRGRRVPEQPYLLQSGQEVGSVLFDVPIVKERVRKFPSYQRDSYEVCETIELDMDPELDSHFAGARSRFLNEAVISECGPSNNKSHNINKEERRSSNPICSTSKCYKKHELHEMENEELFSPSALLAHEKKRSSSLPEPQRKGRRLVKKDIIDLDSEPVNKPISVSDQLDGLITRSNDSNKRRDKKRLRHRVITEDELADSEGNDNEMSPEMARLHTGQVSNVEIAPTPMESSSTDLLSNVNETPKRIFSRLADSTDVSCVICWTNFSSTRGVLPCGHRFCFPCIQSWADVMVSRGRTSTCPLCKASFSSITKVDDASSSDQKIFSQTIPSNSSIKDIFILPSDEMRSFGPQPDPNPVCTICTFREPEDLLVKCHLCEVRCVHSYCLDPPLLPWTCMHCKDLQMMFRNLY